VGDGTLVTSGGDLATRLLWSLKRTVSFDGSNVDFGNPLYGQKCDTTPAYDKKFMSELPQVSQAPSQNPYTTKDDLDVDAQPSET